jgi:Tol biopolymer transport system component
MSRALPTLLAATLAALSCNRGAPAPDAGDAAPSPSAAQPAALAASTDTAPPASDGPDIWIAELTAGEGDVIALGEPRNLTDRPGYDNQPHFLPDGDLLFTRQEGERTDIWRWRAADDRLEPVTRTDPESEYSPTPLPTGDGFSAVRVEADSTQRLWRFALDGSGATVLLPDVAPVGYHAWVSPDTVALFVLGEPATLQVAAVSGGAVEQKASDIGRSLQRVPGRHAFSYVQNEADGTRIRILDLAGDVTEEVATGIAGGDFHAWTPDRVLLQANGGRLLRWHPSMGHWMPVADLSERGLTLSRLAVSPDGRWLAFVAESTTPPGQE